MIQSVVVSDRRRAIECASRVRRHRRRREPGSEGTAMNNWQVDLLNIGRDAKCEHALFSKVEMAVRALGFEHCAYGLRMPFPLSAPRIVLLNNYPSEWQARYLQKDYLAKDPTVLHGRRSQEPLVWRDAVFASTPDLWDEARSFGLCEGWAQSNLDAVGVGGMLTLSRSREPLSAAELASKEATMRWLVSLTHLSLSSIFVPRMVGAVQPALTAREIEVLKWTGDGKTSSEISTLLSISDHTVNFHVRNAVIKLQVANKTAAVVRAAMLGLLN